MGEGGGEGETLPNGEKPMPSRLVLSPNWLGLGLGLGSNVRHMAA